MTHVPKISASPIGRGLLRLPRRLLRLPHALLRGLLAIVRAAFGRGRPEAHAVARARIVLCMLVFAGAYLAIAGRLAILASAPEGAVARRIVSTDAVASARPDIVDRNGLVLATDVKSASLYGEPRRLIDVDEAVEALTAVLPDLDANELRQRLSTDRGFIWLRRDITPQQQREIHNLGLPGIGFMTENRRIYPGGTLGAHVLGSTNIDNQGIAGIEKWVDTRGLADLHLAGFASDRQQEPVELALDLRVQHVLRDELFAAKEKFKAIAAAGTVVDVRTGEIVAMASLPDFDANDPARSLDPKNLNRLTTGVFEMGSTFKALTFAMALDSGRYTINSTLDARGALSFGRFRISDYHAENRVLTLPEVFLFSSNIGTAKMALSLGVDAHKAFLAKTGQLDRLRTELPESAMPIVPKRWGEVNTATIAFGHGLAVAPLQAVMAVNALVNGGYLIPPTFLKRTREEALAAGTPVISPKTSAQMRYLLRLNAEKGSAKKVNVPGFYAGGKTGTAEKVINGRYSKTKLLTTFTGVFPMDNPQYLVLVMLDEPQAVEGTYGYATAGWNAAPTTGKIISRIGPMLGIMPRTEVPPAESLLANTTLARAQ
ncbi:peptidoglycan D,D-transpeptidase FtsI family protein [Ancylobacter vacuolatus]|uniref:Cell division protein FtsI (Penicillin-binding protein 3) n=1 Tax=Ancylobacter vacuolatus TaxID=223389 RepID=A0ABU0DJ01_9HYPH|nr:penicillin-binding protein 2 [Ancylobacter vacuolatus]MDQ0348409.1 cell division protein FtsI (penicillin-binding protein 3) [Ancylobacter vacuolatus]